MHIIDIILKKRNGHALTREEIDFFVGQCSTGKLPDYQTSALLMAIWFRGMDPQETVDLTLSMASSGDQVDLSGIPGIKVDKHSTGGVADTTTLVVGPLVAACGGKVAKMSGRGLGHTGGTLDKLESIPGLSVNQSMNDFIRIVNDCGLSVIGQTADLAPADKKLYSLRDVTGTVDSLPLIASSIMSKKLAAGSDAIVLDVKTGSGAFMKRSDDSRRLAEVMVEIGRHAGKKTLALVTDMNQPLGNAIGNAIEVQEAVEILRGGHPGDLKTVSFALAAQMLMASEICASEDEAMARLDQALSSGEGLERLRQMIEAQGGDPAVCDDVKRLPQSKEIVEARSKTSGYITAMDTEAIGVSALLLGAGRLTKDQAIDPAVGIWLEKRIGDRVETGEVLSRFYVDDRADLDESIKRFVGAIRIEDKPPETVPLIYTKIE